MEWRIMCQLWMLVAAQQVGPIFCWTNLHTRTKGAWTTPTPNATFPTTLPRGFLKLIMADNGAFLTNFMQPCLISMNAVILNH